MRLFLFLGFSPCPLRDEAAGVKYFFEKSKVKIPCVRSLPGGFLWFFLCRLLNKERTGTRSPTGGIR